MELNYRLSEYNKIPHETAGFFLHGIQSLFYSDVTLMTSIECGK